MRLAKINAQRLKSEKNILPRHLSLAQSQTTANL